jgi:hypothetical protein
MNAFNKFLKKLNIVIIEGEYGQSKDNDDEKEANI